MRLAGSVALVTGANRGLGRAFVAALLDRGVARVHAAARRPEALAPLRDMHGDRVVPLQLDVTDQAQVDRAAAAAPDVTLLLNNAGVLAGSGLLDAGSVAPLQEELAVNAVGPARMALAFAPAIERNGGGAIVNMLAIASLCTAPHFGTYSAAKMAAMALTQGLRCDLAGRGIEVFGIYAGLIDTDMIAFIDQEKSSPAAIAARSLDGIEAGIPEIDADDRAVALRQAMRDDPDGALAAMFRRARQVRSARPAGRNSE